MSAVHATSGQGSGHVNEQEVLQTFYGFPGCGWRGWAGMGAAAAEVIPEKLGNLIVDILDGDA